MCHKCHKESKDFKSLNRIIFGHGHCRHDAEAAHQYRRSCRTFVGVLVVLRGCSLATLASICGLPGYRSPDSAFGTETRERQLPYCLGLVIARFQRMIEILYLRANVDSHLTKRPGFLATTHTGTSSFFVYIQHSRSALTNSKRVIRSVGEEPGMLFGR